MYDLRHDPKRKYFSEFEMNTPSILISDLSDIFDKEIEGEEQSVHLNL